MLRQLFGETRRQDVGLMHDANHAIESYLARLGKQPKNRKTVDKERRLELWSRGFIRALDELEQSVYCARRCGANVNKQYVEDMSEEEQDDYHRHIYFYKNAFIRLFSILDKIGYFMNEAFDLKTEQVKLRFSYFTVLRTMHQRGIETELEQCLYDMKVKYKPELERLRNQRNMEIHMLNADLLDDLLNAKEMLAPREEKTHVENISGNMDDLTISFEMTCRALICLYDHMLKRSGGRKRT
ncbi:Cthe_2314 family HEPN domain-containing protein [Paenibacillus thalictri]|uniref:Cthe-2314-like HEPN domain-containing protein n=1 Tax=Paenibacillus thalictri TaxID=2527873 RepID=A0A4Q9DGW6_9BACL|nr:Cthe_2314 family HEPN domain-containing protein [Paenibacillus thalictri]TBL71524.1 hypothetical protein EYB31_29535 [Paenibacillus thalictri]